MAKSLSDPVIFEAINRFGGDGYMVFFGTLELMADEFDVFNPGIMTFSWKFLRKNLQLSKQKLVTIYEFFDEIAKENKTKDKGFIIDYNDNEITIMCRKLAELCDEHTRKTLNKIQESIRSKSGVSQSGRYKITDNIYKKKRKEYIKGQKAFDLARKFYNIIKENKKDFKPPNFQMWAADIDLMIKIDKRDPDTIMKLFGWCQHDDFEKTNVLSPAKLRKRFDQLELKMQRDKGKGPGIYKNGKRVM